MVFVDKCLREIISTSLLGRKEAQIHTDSSKYSSRILYLRPITPRQQPKPQNRHKLIPKHKDTPLLDSISNIRSDDGEEASDDVGRDTHELGVVGGVAHVFYDGGQEEGEGVDGTEAGHAD